MCPRSGIELQVGLQVATMNTRQRCRTVALVTVLACLASFMCEGRAWAQTMSGEVPTPKYQLQRWRPGPNPADFLTVHGANVGDHLRITGGTYFNIATDPLAFNTGIEAGESGIVSHQLYADVFASFNLFDWVDTALVLPVGLSQSSETRGEPFDTNFDSAGLGDLRFVAKGRILELGEFPVGVGIVGVLNMPTGDETQLYGDDGFGFDAIVPVEFSPYGRIRIATNIGYRYRPTAEQFTDRFRMGDSVLLSGAASIPFFLDDLDFLIEIHGEIHVDPDNEELTSEERPVEGEIGFRYRIWNDDEELAYLDDLAVTAAFGIGSGAVGSPTTRTIIGIGYQWVNGGSWGEQYKYKGVISEIEECPDPETTPPDQIPAICRENEPVDSDGDGVPDSKDKCPFHGTPGEIDEFGCSTADMDGDGIPDTKDKCPAVPEDPDGFEDSDGCPDLDNDGDGIADLSDKCPLEQEVINGIDDEDGCPDTDPDARVQLEGGKVNIKEQVFFETAKAKIKKQSFPLLNEVADVLKNNPHVGNIEIEGHTDDRGDDDYNKKLSQRRADSVRDYLIDQGVDEGRLTAIGYGEEHPIADNETKDGRAKNRRVEFTVRGVKEE